MAEFLKTATGWFSLTEKDTVTEKEQATAEIMNLFRFYYKHDWAPDNIFAGKSRAWVNSFNELIKKGMIIRKKAPPGYNYKWAAEWPENY